MASFVGSPEPVKSTTDAWHVYAQHFKHLPGVDNDSMAKQCHLLLALIGNSTFKLLANLLAPRKPGELWYKQIFEQLQKHFH